MVKLPLRRPIGFGVAVAGVAIATVVRLALSPVVGAYYPFLTYFFALLLTSWICGRGPSIASLGLGLVASCCFILPGILAEGASWSVYLVGLPLYLAVGMVTIAIVEGERRIRRRLEEEIDRRHRLEEGARLQARVLESMTEGVSISDEQGIIVYTNSAEDRIFGYAPGELVGQHVTVLNDDSPNENARSVAAVIETLEVEGSWSGERKNRRKDGTTFWTFARITAMEREGRRYRVCVQEDITERKLAEKRLRDSERLYRAIGESIDYGVWVCDPDGRNVYASDSFLRLVGLTQEQCSSFGWGDVLHPDDAERTIAAWKECVRTGGTWDIEHRFKGVDGRYHPILARGLPVRDERGVVTCWAGINLDIRRLKDAEEALRDQDRRKDEFLAMLAHELRNPLAPIRNATSIMELAEDDREAQRWSRELIDRQLRQLSRLVDDLLDVSRITQGKIVLTTEPLEVSSFINLAEEASRPLLESKHHTLEVSLPSEPMRLEGDLTRLSQVVQNLLNNAAKFTPEGGLVRLRVTADGETCRISVRDNGEGIASDSMPRIFDLFTQASRSPDRSQGGLGIGLTLVKRLVEMHGGTVQASSEGHGRGSEFVVSLPLLRAAAEPPPMNGTGKHHRVKNGHSRRILVVDDRADMRNSLSRLLGMAGHEVMLAEDGATAIESAIRFRPDLVLLDIGLPGMDGYEVARRLRREPAVEGVSLVALTGYGSESDRARTREAGFDHHLVKPVEFALLQELLNETRAIARS